MSYDIYCYKSKLGRPDEEEADAVISNDNDKWAVKDKDAVTKLAIVKGLIELNPRLQAFDFDYGEIAQLTATTIDEVKSKFDHIELNPVNAPTQDLAVQLTVFDNHVFISVPYWYKDQKAEQLFIEINCYIKAIRRIAGYLVYDPQTGEVFDPAENSLHGLTKYLSISENLEEITGDRKITRDKKKSWWKFW